MRRDAATADAGPHASDPPAHRAALRRGLPRTPGGEPWPPEGVAPVGAISTIRSAEAPRASGVDRSAPESVPDARADGAAAPVAPRRFTRSKRTDILVLGALALLIAAAGAVLVARWALGSPAVQDFLAVYPGEYELPATAPVGIPAWLAWQHFLNAFFIVLIIRSGLHVRREQRPAAYWTSRRRPERRISLLLWFHLSLDVLWLVNGVVFVVVLFATGQWMRLVPTSWEVIPNAASAMLQYIAFDWPTENGWVNYNSLQQLAYFSTVFIAAPLAAITGARMSAWWPERWSGLGRLIPVAVARAIHFPVMLYFVVFIVVHVGLVLATGAVRNLNHMYAARDGDDLTGLVIFIVSLAVIAAAWIAARPTALATLARLFGRVGR